MNILLVDDDFSSVCALVDMLPDGHKTYTAFTGQEACKIAEMTSLDLIVSDYHLPGMDGLSVFKTLRDRGVDAPMIMVSGYSLNSVTKAEMEKLQFSFFPKPLAINDFMLKVQEVEKKYTSIH